jgi:RHS repeat-associated protein
MASRISFADIQDAALSWKVEYDDQGRTAAEIDPSGSRTEFEYHETDGVVRRLKKKPQEGPQVQWEFNVSGRLSRMTDGEGSTSYDYDIKGRLQQVHRTDLPAIAYHYDRFGRTTKISVGDFCSVEYGYDFLGRLEDRTVKALNPRTGRETEFPVGYEYRAGEGVVIRTLPNGIRTRWTYNPIGKLQEILHVNAQNFVLLELTYTHGPQGLITGIKERSRRGELTERYTYDKMGRLTQTARSDGRLHGYSYDSVGNRLIATTSNRLPQASEFDWAGRITAFDGHPCRFDGAGNLAELTLDGAALRFRYHGGGRLAEAQNGSRRVQYRYDGEGRLIARRSGTLEARFLCDPLCQLWQPLAILEPDESPIFVIWDGVTPLMTIRDGQPEYFLHDHLGSVRALVDAGGQVSRYLDYDPFGTPATDTLEMGNLQPRFAGCWLDVEAGVYLTLARSYLPQTGNFLQPDPVHRMPVDPQMESSLFQYCGGNPICLVDRRGEAGEWYDDFLISDLSEKNFDLAKDPLLEWAEELPGNWGKGVAYFNLVSGIQEVISNAAETSNYLREHHGDPAGDMKALSFGLGAWGFLAGSSLAGLLATQVDLGITLGSATRSRLLQNRAERLASFGGAILPTVTEFLENRGRRGGRFSWHGRGYSAHGGWRLAGSFQGWLGRNRDFEAWAVSEVLNLFTAQGERISGEFSRREEWHERGGSLLNLYEPTSLTITRRIHDVYRIRRGQGLESPVEPTSYRKVPKPEAPEVEVETKPPYIRHREDFPPDRRDPPPPPPRRRRFVPAGQDPPDDGPAPAAVGPSGGDPRDRGGAAIASPVGGVYLGGFSGTFEGFGTLKGVRLDSNGNLVLLAAAGGDVRTPPLRLDDVVTVFRSVYLYGEGPTVTIDPASQDPKKSPMVIRHSKATEGTYVGWILYQADRLMKGYTLGVDNITEQEFVSRVPGYREVVDTIYFGGGDPGKRQKDGYWERFWIVPTEARRFEGPRHELTLVDVPLKVNTQSMKWKRRELIDDLSAESSPGARAFTAWFTANYGRIAAEQYLPPPPESGLTQPVPVFAELQRIALITAIAETLRDQGVPIPFWMRDYKVGAVAFEKTTPGLQVTRERGKVSTRIFGGVSLSPNSQDVKTFSAATQLASVFPGEVTRGVELASALETTMVLAPSLVGAPPFRTERLVHEGERLCTVTVPGGATRAVGACRFEEVDLVAPLSDGRLLKLLRRHNSFFAPDGPWGQGWTLDLPRLIETGIPVQRDRDSVRYVTAHELITPLNTVYARFRDLRIVPELRNSRLQVPDHEGGRFYGLANDQPKFLGKSETHLLILKDGTRWHFTLQGDLAAIEEGGLVTLYDRDSYGRVNRIVGLLGGVKDAAITLHYNLQGRLDYAEASASVAGGSPPKLRVDYEYDSSGRLAGVRSSQGMVGYRYEGPWVKAITWRADDGDGQSRAEEIVLRTFVYNSQGQLLEETTGQTTTRHTILAGPETLTVTSTTGKDDALAESTHLDSRLRPLESTTADGTRTCWRYPSEGRVEIEVTLPDQPTVRITQSAEARRWSLRVGDAPPVDADYDSAGRLVALAEGGQKLLDQQWRPDGQVAHVETGPRAISFQYDDKGLLSAVIEHPSAEKDTFQHWQETTYDRQGHPIALTNYQGLKLAITYDVTGNLASMVQKTAKGDIGVNLRRDNHGRLLTVQSPWGDIACIYDKVGELRQVATTRSGGKAWAEFEGGAVHRQLDFEGGETVFDYNQDGPHASLLREVLAPDGLRLTYDYNERSWLTRVRVGHIREVKVTYDDFGRPVTYSWTRPANS